MNGIAPGAAHRLNAGEILDVVAIHEPTWTIGWSILLGS